jgi:hypothetical protein
MMMSVLEKACRACKSEHALPTLSTGEKSLFLGPAYQGKDIIVFRLIHSSLRDLGH